ncbi:hypothetical protein Tco_1328814 [Tanacetum coccineum]
MERFSNVRMHYWAITPLAVGCLTSTAKGDLPSNSSAMTRLDPSKDSVSGKDGISRTPKSLTLEIHHGGCFTPTPSRSYVGGQVSSVNVVDIDEFCLHDLKDMVVKLGYGVADLMYYHFLIPRLGLYYGLHPLNVDADVLEMAKYVKDYKIILVYVKHGSSIFVTPKKEVAIAVDNHLRNGLIEIDLTPMCYRNLSKEWEQVSGKSLSIGEVMKNLSKKQTASSVEGPIVVESADDPFEELDEILSDYANTGKQITGMTSIGSRWKFKEVEVDVDNESEEESDTEENYTSGSDLEDFDYDPKHDEVFNDDENIVEDVHVSMNNFSFTADPKHDLSIDVVEVKEDDLDVIDYDSFSSDLDDGIDSKRRIQLRFLSDHVIKSLATNSDISVRAIQDQMQKQFDVGVSKMKAFRVKRIVTDKITGSFREQYS